MSGCACYVDLHYNRVVAYHLDNGNDQLRESASKFMDMLTDWWAELQVSSTVTAQILLHENKTNLDLYVQKYQEIENEGLADIPGLIHLMS